MFWQRFRFSALRSTLLVVLLFVCSLAHSQWIPDSSLYLATGDGGQIVVDTHVNQIDFVANVRGITHIKGHKKFRGDLPFSITPLGFSGEVVGKRREFWNNGSNAHAGPVLMSANGRYFSPITPDETIRVFDRVNPERSMHFGTGIALGFLGDGDVLAYLENSLPRGRSRTMGAITRLVVRNVVTEKLLYSRRFAHDFGPHDSYGEWSVALKRYRDATLPNTRFVVFGQPRYTNNFWIYDHKNRTVIHSSFVKPSAKSRMYGPRFSFSPDGSLLAVFGQGARVVDTDTWKPIAALQVREPGNADSVPFGTTASAFTPDSRYLIAGRSNGVAVYETATGKLVDQRHIDQRERSGGETWVNTTGSVVAFATSDASRGPRHLRLWEIKYGKISDTDLCGAVCEDSRLSNPKNVAISSDGKRLMVYTDRDLYSVDIVGANVQKVSFSRSQVSTWLNHNDGLPLNTQCLMFEHACKQVSAPYTPYWDYDGGSKIRFVNQNKWPVPGRAEATARECYALRDPNICTPHFKQLVADGQYEAVATFCRESTMLCHEAAKALDGNGLISNITEDEAKASRASARTRKARSRKETPMSKARQTAFEQTVALACWEAASLQACQHVDGLEDAMLHHARTGEARGTPHYIVQKLVAHLHQEDSKQGWPMKRLLQYSSDAQTSAAMPPNDSQDVQPEGLSELAPQIVPINDVNSPDEYLHLKKQLLGAALLVFCLFVIWLAFKIPIIMLPAGAALLVSPIWVWMNFPQQLIFTGSSPGGIIVFILLVTASVIAVIGGVVIMLISLVSLLTRR